MARHLRLRQRCETASSLSAAATLQNQQRVPPVASRNRMCHWNAAADGGGSGGGVVGAHQQRGTIPDGTWAMTTRSMVVRLETVGY